MAFRVLLTRLAFQQQLRRSLPVCKFKSPVLAFYSNGITQIDRSTECKGTTYITEPPIPQPTDSLESLFRFAGRTDLTGHQAVTVLKVLSEWTIQGKTNYTDFKNDSKFVNVCQVLESKCQQVSYASLISGLRSLLEIGMPETDHTLNLMENQVMWKARKMPVRHLITCLHHHHKFQNSDLQKKVVLELVQNVQRRWFEIVESSDLLKVMQIANLFTEEFISKVEDRLLDMLEKMSVQEMFQLLMMLAQKNHRPRPLLRAIAFHLNQSNEKLNRKQLISTFRALTVLTFPDQVLLHRISSDLLPEIANIEKEKAMSSLLTSIGMLKWRHPGLLDACGEWILKNLESSGRHQVLASYISTLGRINYCPESPDNILELVSSQLTQNTVDSNATWLDVVWSLCILGKAKSEHVISVLNSDFYNSVLDIDDRKSISCKLKLLNIQAVALIEMNYSPEMPVAGITLKEMETVCPAKGNDFSKMIIETLKTFIPQGKFLAINLKTPLGLFIDCEFIVNSACKPVPIGDYGVQGGNVAVKKALPSNLHRVAVLALDYKDYALNSRAPIGVRALTVRLLKELRYVVIELPYFEFPMNATTLNKVQYVQKKIQESIQNASQQQLPQR